MESNRGVVVSLVHLGGLEDQLVVNVIKLFFFVTDKGDNRTARIRCICRKTTVLRCHRCLINTGVEKMNNI
jgi:hypothetical protein